MLRNLMMTLLAAPLVASAASAQVFEPMNNFPSAAPSAFGVTAAALPDGRFLVWNGDTVFVQFAPNADSFQPIATGYIGDPSFVAIAPDGQEAILGAGFSGDLYRLNLNNPQDFAPSAVVANAPHFAGVYLTQDLLLVDAGKPAFAGSELAIVDLSSAKRGAVVSVLAIPGVENKDLIVDKPPFTYSAVLGVDEAEGLVYAMSTFGVPSELRAFAIADILNAYNTSTPLDWTTDGVLIGAAGQFHEGGVAGVLPNGDVIIPGNGDIQIIDPRLDDPTQATIVDSFDPSGVGGFYSVFYNPFTDTIVAWDGVTAYAPAGVVQAVPVASAAGLFALGAALAGFALRRRR